MPCSASAGVLANGTIVGVRPGGIPGSMGGGIGGNTAAGQLVAGAVHPGQ